MGKHGKDEDAKGGDNHAGGNKMGKHEKRHQQDPKERSDKIVKRVKDERNK